MNLEPAPRLNKTYFVLTAAGCIAAVVLIGFFAPNKFAPLPFLSAVGFLLVSIIAIMIPLIVDYGADSAEYIQQERARVSDQVQRLHTAGESLARAAAQIKAVEEAVHKTAHAAENLPYRMQEKLAEFNETLAEKEESDREALEQELAELRSANSDKLKAVADKIAAAAADWSALEATTRKQLAAAQAGAQAAESATARLNDKLQATLAQLDARITALDKAASNVPVAAVHDRREEATPTDDGGHRPPPQKDPLPAPVIESVTLSEAPAPVVEEPKPKKPRAPRKPRPEETLAAMSETPAAEPEPVSAATSDEPAGPPDEAPAKAESSTSSDGATRLLATAYIGIGNKLFIRGDGPGLSWDRGVPMQFVSIGKWGWSTQDATGPVTCKLYKNDETAALSGEVTLEPGKHVEITALF